MTTTISTVRSHFPYAFISDEEIAFPIDCHPAGVCDAGFSKGADDAVGSDSANAAILGVGDI